ncbi:tape measure protein [Leuconostoc lactis]|uniref:tape measure protein n=1 Tax=Leuconostoc lactis TaxID=1246 RepID=UPI00020DA2D5|nr:tape measure protein [Leuconostoc lactis]
MAKQIVNEMATNLTLDSKSAAAAIKQLTQEVKSASAESKIMENQYKAAGDTLNASKAKYEGLQTTIEKQKAKVDDLKQALENNNTTTKKGQELQTYLTNELAKAERQYASYNGQLAKAEQAYKYQESGLAKLNEEIKHGNDLTDARVKKLEAEGNKEEAQKVKLDNLKNVQEKYNQMLTIQKNELNKLSESGDKNSDAYKRQQLRVEQMGAKVAETTRDIKRFNETDIKPETRGLNHVKEQLSSLNQSLEGTRSHLKSIFLGNLAANGVTSALESMKDKFTDLIREGAEYNKEQQVMAATWDTLTGDAKKGQAMVDSVNSISTAFGQSSDLTNELEQQFYHVFNQQGPTDTLTKSVLTMADTIGMSADETQRLGLNFTHMMSSTKLQLGDFNMITDQLPMYGEKLLEFEQQQQKNHNLTMAQLRDQMSAGKISAEDAEKVMNELGEKYSKASENMMSTTAGMERVISARGTALAGALTKPIMEAKNPLFGAVSKWVSDKNTENEFTKVGDSVSKSFSTITEAFGKQFKSSTFTEGADNFMKSLSTNIEKFGDYIAKHAGDITNFFKMTKELGGAGFGIVGSTLKVAIPLLERLGSFASKHPTTFKVLAGSIIGLNLALKGTLGAIKAFDTVKSVFGGIKTGLGGLKKAGKGVGKAFKWTGKLLLNGAKKALSGFATFAKGTGKAIGKGLKFTASIATKGAKLAMAGLVKAAKVTGKGLKLAFNFLKANPFILIITGIVAVVAAFVELYKHNKKFRTFINGLVKGAQDFFKGIGKWFGQAWKKISKFFGDVIGFVKKDWKEILLLLVNPFAGAFALLYKHNANFKKNVDNLVKSVVGFFKDLWRNVTDIFGNIADFISSTLSGIGKFWDKTWNTIFGTVRNIWNYISKLVHDSISGISDVIGNVLGGIGNVWRGTWQGLSDFFGGIWKSIKGFASDGINGVLNVINAGVDAIDSVWKFFTGHETSIHHLQPVKFSQGGVVTQRLAMVNDGDGPDWKELIQLPNGEMKMSQKRNAVMPLPVGTRVYNGAETKAIMNYAGIKKYANGGVVGGAIDWAKGALSNVGSWIGDKFDAIDSFLKNPLNAVMGLIQKATSGLIGGLGNFGQLASGTLDKLMSPISDWFTKGLKKVQEEGQGAPAGAGVQRWAEQVKSALSANGLSTSEAMVQKVLRQIQTESGGNEKAVQGNIGDVNNASGDLAKGLMQVISATFNAFKFPGHNNPFNGYDSLLAGLNYAKNRYGSNLSFLGQGHGYANGGLITQHQIAEIGEGNKPEMIIPLDGMKSSRGFELLGKTAVAMAARDGQTSQGMSDSSEVTQLLNQNNQLLGVVTQILGAILSETENGNQPLSALSINRLSRLITSSTVRSAN